MDKKIFFLDLDGTTLRDDKTIPEENIAAVKDALDRGHYVVVSTGRALVAARPIAERLGVCRPGGYLSSFNGAIIYDLGTTEQILNLKLPDEDVRYLFDEAARYGLHIQSYDEGRVLSEEYNDELQYYLNITGMEPGIIPDLGKRTVFDTPKVIVMSVGREDSHERLEKFKEDHADWQQGKCASMFSTPYMLEYCRADATKASVVKFFEQQLGVAHLNTIALGDEENDLPMLFAAGHGYAMKNAPERILARVENVTRLTNNEGGVADVMREYI